jgi:uncharacterized protein YjgD (DUF1641 family)
MTLVAYTVCDNGLRFFTDLSGVCVSYDPQLLKRMIADRDGAVQRNKAHVESMREQLSEVQAQQTLPPIVNLIMEHNHKMVEEQIREHRRVSTAEAAINDQLVRDVMYFDDTKQAVAYTAGVAVVAEES